MNLRAGALASNRSGFKVHFWNFPVTLGKWLNLLELQSAHLNGGVALRIKYHSVENVRGPEHVAIHESHRDGEEEVQREEVLSHCVFLFDPYPSFSLA